MMFTELCPEKIKQGAIADREECSVVWSAFYVDFALQGALMKCGVPVWQHSGCSVATDHALVEHKHPVPAFCGKTVDTRSFCGDLLWTDGEMLIHFLIYCCILLPPWHQIFAPYISAKNSLASTRSFYAIFYLI